MKVTTYLSLISRLRLRAGLFENRVGPPRNILGSKRDEITGV